jgi:site-specific DNA-methyltransferase (adenine-specific)
VLADLRDIDAIITDAPYSREFLPLYDDLAIWADKVLKPDGLLAVMTGQTHLPEVFRRLDGRRPYRWTLAYLTPGQGYGSLARQLQSHWKPVLIYGGGPRFDDVVIAGGSGDANKSHHKWGQSLEGFEVLVDRLTLPGQMVADPFVGGGTTLLAAKAHGRHSVGCDIDKKSVNDAKKRLKSLEPPGP